MNTPPKNGKQSSLFDLPGVAPFNGADLARCAIAAHAADDNPDKAGFIAASASALILALADGPCSVAQARARFGVKAPHGVDARAAGAAPLKLWRAGRIEPAGWFSRSPWSQAHDCPGRVWRLPSGGGA